MLRSVFEARARPALIASSKLLAERELISVTFATETSDPPFDVAGMWPSWLTVQCRRNLGGWDGRSFQSRLPARGKEADRLLQPPHSRFLLAWRPEVPDPLFDVVGMVPSWIIVQCRRKLPPDGRPVVFYSNRTETASASKETTP
jgi:hypothetical protein